MNSIRALLLCLVVPSCLFLGGWTAANIPDYVDFHATYDDSLRWTTPDDEAGFLSSTGWLSPSKLRVQNAQDMDQVKELWLEVHLSGEYTDPMPLNVEVTAGYLIGDPWVPYDPDLPHLVMPGDEQLHYLYDSDGVTVLSTVLSWKWTITPQPMWGFRSFRSARHIA